MSASDDIALAQQALAKVAQGDGVAGHVVRHIFLCAEPQKGECCSHAVGSQAWAYLKKRCKQLGLGEQGIH